jgi:hypothetical protein
LRLRLCLLVLVRLPLCFASDCFYCFRINHFKIIARLNAICLRKLCALALRAQLKKIARLCANKLKVGNMGGSMSKNMKWQKCLAGFNTFGHMLKKKQK